MQVITSAIDLGDGVSIERAQPSTAFQPMPHITTYTGLIARNQVSQPTDAFIKLGDIKGEFQSTEFTGDSLIGVGSDSPNDMTGQGDLALGVLGPLSIVQLDGQTFYKGPGGQLLGPLGGEGVFKPQRIEDKGSVIFGDNHFRTGGGDSLTGNETSQITDQPTDDFIKLGDIKGFIGDQDPGAGYCTGYCFEAFEPIVGMNSFGESLNPLLENGSNSGPGGTTFMTGNIGFPNNNITGSASPGGDDI